MRGLIDKLNEASRRYYDQNESDISDDEWDAMYAELRKLEEKTGERMADSPTRRVGGAVMEGFEQHRHIARLWSMDKAQKRKFLPGHSDAKSRRQRRAACRRTATA